MSFLPSGVNMAPSTGLFCALITDLAMPLQLEAGKPTSVARLCENEAPKRSSGCDVRFVFLSACG